MFDDDKMTWTEAYEQYDQALDEEGLVRVAGLEYLPSRILRTVDPIAYRTGFNDWADSQGIETDDLIGPDPYP